MEKELSKNELEQKLRTKKLYMGFLIGMTISILMIAIFDFIKTKEFNLLFAISIVLLLIIFYLSKQVSKINIELKNREKSE
jgi:uncharacterized membrane protein